MFINNNVVVEQLKDRVWEDYKKIKGGDFKSWYNGLSPVEQVAWTVKFDEVNLCTK
jgi:hypothetical protein